METLHVKRVHWTYGPAGGVRIVLVDTQNRDYFLTGDRTAMEDLRQATMATLKEGPDLAEMDKRAIEAFGQG